MDTRCILLYSRKYSLDRNSPSLDRRFAMKYTKEQRLNIGRRIYDGEISRYEAAEEYGISDQTARDYMRMCWNANQLPPKHGPRSIGAPSFKKAPAELDELKAMTKEELIQELIKAKITEARGSELSPQRFLAGCLFTASSEVFSHSSFHRNPSLPNGCRCPYT